MKPVKKWKGKTDYMKAKNKLWNVMREYIFLKHGEVCYTCGMRNLKGSNRQLGHFHPGSTCPITIYFDEDNLRPQCHACNNYKSGNPHVYRYKLIQEIGEERVQRLDRKQRQDHGSKWYLSDFQAKIKEYEEKIKKLRAEGKRLHDD